MFAALQPFLLVTVFVLLYAAEHLYPQRRELLNTRHDARNIGFGLLAFAVVAGAGYGVQRLLEWLKDYRFGILYWCGFSALANGLLAFFVLDCFMYFWHRANHRVSFLWHFHAFHHADERMNSTTALRFHAVELLLANAVRVPLFLVLGMDALSLAVYNLVFMSVVVFHHSNVRLHPAADRVLRLLIVTPGLHRIHHSVRFEETDSNFGSVLSCWDEIFRTRRARAAGPVIFGIPGTQA